MQFRSLLERFGFLRPNIFISYRRSDSGGYAGQLLSRLQAHYGRRSLFLDHDTITAGDKFAAELEAALERADVVLALIGPDWVTAQRDGGRRLDDPADWVRREISQSLERDVDVRLIPVLVGGAVTPERDDLPAVLKPMLDNQTQAVRADRFDDDVDALIREIGGWRRPGPPILGLLAVIFLTIAALVILNRGPDQRGPMAGDFNVAVADFIEISADGTVENTARSGELARTVSKRFGDDLDALNEAEGFNFQVRHPDQVGPVPGATEFDRAQAASDLADEIDADVVVYGVLTDDGLAPQFYLRARGGNLEDAEELGGQYELGSKILGSVIGSGSITENAALRLQLAARTEALVQFVVGLSWYGDGRYDLAADAFDRADVDAWAGEDGKEILHLFKGNAAGNQGDLLGADAEYDLALGLNEGYARALIGRGTVGFLSSKVDCEEANADVNGLRDAAADFDRALAAPDQPEISNVPAKAAFGLGRTYSCLSQALAEDRWADAEDEFTKVVDDFERGNDSIRSMAIESYAGLAFIALPFESDPDPGPAYCKTVMLYDTAAELSDDPAATASFATNRSFAVMRLDELGIGCPGDS